MNHHGGAALFGGPSTPDKASDIRATYSKCPSSLPMSLDPFAERHSDMGSDMTGLTERETFRDMPESSEQAPARKRRGPGRPFKKGQPSPNPGGRPRLWPEVRALAQQHTDEVIATLANLMRHSPRDEVRRAAACDLWDRAWGRPLSQVVADVSVSHTVDVDALKARLAARVAGLVVAREALSAPAQITCEPAGADSLALPHLGRGREPAPQ
jgi:hypothetical protein